MANLKIFNKSISDLSRLNQPYFYDRLYFVLREDGINLNYGDFSARILKNGTIKVLKSLGLYCVKGARENKISYINPKVELIINTTVSDSQTIVKSIIELANGEVNNLDKIEINDLSDFMSLDDDYPCSVNSSKCTYIIYNPDNKLYKIGRSSNVFDRLNTLRNEISSNLEIVGYIDHDIEGKLHKEYVKKREFGEWFSINIDDVLDIKNKHSLNIIQTF